jgi:hypothetical protein
MADGLSLLRQHIRRQRANRRAIDLKNLME